MAESTSRSAVRSGATRRTRASTIRRPAAPPGDVLDIAPAPNPAPEPNPDPSPDEPLAGPAAVPAPLRRMTDAMVAGQWYRTDDPAIASRHLASQDLVDAYNATGARQRALRRNLLGALLAEVGADVDLRAPLYIDHGTQVRIGDRTSAGPGLTIGDQAAVTIGADVQFGAHVQLVTQVTPVEHVPRTARWARALPIEIGDAVHLGAGTVVTPGVRIGPRTVVAPGSVVTMDLPADVLAEGNPARILRPLTDPGTEPGT